MNQLLPHPDWLSLPHRRWLLVLWALITPLVLIAGIQWKLNGFRSEDFSIRVDRSGIVNRAVAFLEQQGFPVGVALPHFEMERNDELLEHLHRSALEPEPRIRINELPVAAARFRVSWRGEREERREVSIGPDGRVVGFSLPVPDRGLFVPDDASRMALELGEKALSQALRYRERYLLSEPRVYEQSGDNGQPIFRVEWSAVHQRAPELVFVLRFGIANEQVFSQEIVADVDDEVVARSGFTHAFREVLGAVAPFYFLALLIYMLVRYLQRSLEKEVSHGRAAVVGFYLIAIIGVLYLAGDSALFLRMNTDGDSPLFVNLFALALLCLVALFMGGCYAACEGEVREQFPRSLTSFDALLTGRVLSHNVARAFLIGFGAACWLFTFQVLVNLRFEGGLGEPSAIVAVYQLVASRIPYVYVFLLLPIGVGLLMLLGFLVPLSLVPRFGRLRWLAWVLLAAMSFTNLVILHGGFASPEGMVLIIGVEAVLLLWLIVAVDLLTGYVCLVLSGYLTLLTDAQLLTNLPSEVQWFMHGLVATTAALSLVLLRYGRQLSDEDVRPAYAKALAERQMLSEQLSTAALAQRQLMLRELPALEDFSVAYECSSADVVSGDYFDCYPLGSRRMGVLLISGAGRGLLDAMVIAFTKGFLAERTSRVPSPQDLLAELLEALTAVLQSADRFPELCYLALDGEQQTALYSRTPGFPELATIRERPGRLPAVTGGGSAEMLATRMLPSGRSMTLCSGVVKLEKSAVLLTFTRGFENGMHLAGVLDIREWLRQHWQEVAADDAADLLVKLRASAFGRTGVWRGGAPQEDVTVFAVRVTGNLAAEPGHDEQSSVTGDRETWPSDISQAGDQERAA